MSTTAQQEWYARNRERLAAERQALRLQVLALYGGKCVCCGESNPAFLTLGHPNKDGGAERKERRARGNSFYRKLLAEGPQADIQCECWNCNMAHGLYGSCPHKEIS